MFSFIRKISRVKAGVQSVRSQESEKVIQAGVEWLKEKFSKDVCSTKTDVEIASFCSEDIEKGLKNDELKENTERRIFSNRKAWNLLCGGDGG